MKSKVLFITIGIFGTLVIALVLAFALKLFIVYRGDFDRIEILYLAEKDKQAYKRLYTPKHSLGKFSKLKIGMTREEVFESVGYPTSSMDFHGERYRYKISKDWYIYLRFSGLKLDEIRIVDYSGDREFKVVQKVDTLWFAGDQFNRSVAYDSLVYGGQTYRTVKIGAQVWMAENLNFKTGRSACYKNDEGSCEKYGRLYDWYDAINACPDGWRLPGDEDWDSLVLEAKGQRVVWGTGGYYWDVAGKKLKSRIGWKNTRDGISDSGTDDFGFSALPGGKRSSGSSFRFSRAGEEGTWWSATEHNERLARTRDMTYNLESVHYGYDSKTTTYSVRCLRDSAAVRTVNTVQPAAAPDTAGGSFTDLRDARTYRTVRVGKVTWMAENLNLKTKRSKCYGNKKSNCQKYGRLYDWNDAMNACPAGWRVPGKEDWDSLVAAADAYLSPNHDTWETAGKKLKAKDGWDYDDESNITGGGTDDFGFSALPGGWGYGRDDVYFSIMPAIGGRAGNFRDAGSDGHWWSANEDGASAYNWSMSYRDDDVSASGSRKTTLSSLRCVEDHESPRPPRP